MTDALGWRKKFAVLVPSTNTAVQPEFDSMRPAGVTNHISRIRIPNMPLQSNDDFKKLIELIVVAQMEAVDSAMSMEPDRLGARHFGGVVLGRLFGRQEAQEGPGGLHQARRLHGLRTPQRLR
jgi:hypothetical protein